LVVCFEAVAELLIEGFDGFEADWGSCLTGIE
jgi:hypothetical protein